MRERRAGRRTAAAAGFGSSRRLGRREPSSRSCVSRRPAAAASSSLARAEADARPRSHRRRRRARRRLPPSVRPSLPPFRALARHASLRSLRREATRREARGETEGPHGRGVHDESARGPRRRGVLREPGHDGDVARGRARRGAARATRARPARDRLRGRRGRIRANGEEARVHGAMGRERRRAARVVARRRRRGSASTSLPTAPARLPSPSRPPPRPGFFGFLRCQKKPRV